MTLEPYDIKQDDKATELPYWECCYYYNDRFSDVRLCNAPGNEGKYCLQEVDPPCPILEEILREVENGS